MLIMKSRKNMENLNQSYLQELRKNNEGNNRANVSTS